MKVMTIDGAQLGVEVPDDMPLFWVPRDVLGMTAVRNSRSYL
jgi:aerobic-type carbon monoxide dehydrogenase small subunit (CoxS/CutS family)